MEVKDQLEGSVANESLLLPRANVDPIALAKLVSAKHHFAKLPGRDMLQRSSCWLRTGGVLRDIAIVISNIFRSTLLLKTAI